MPKLPSELLRHIADAEIEVLSWAAEDDGMVLKMTKEIGHEQGLLYLNGVGEVHLRPRFIVACIAAYDKPFPDYPHLQLDPGDFAIAFQESWGTVYVVTATAVSYVKMT